MTRQQLDRQVATWKDYAVLLGIAVNLITVGAMYGSLSTATARNTEDLQQVRVDAKEERDARLSGDEHLRTEFTQADLRLDAKIDRVRIEPAAR
jgi:hypothetical protein